MNNNLKKQYKHKHLINKLFNLKMNIYIEKKNTHVIKIAFYVVEEC